MMIRSILSLSVFAAIVAGCATTADAPEAENTGKVGQALVGDCIPALEAYQEAMRIADRENPNTVEIRETRNAYNACLARPTQAGPIKISVHAIDAVDENDHSSSDEPYILAYTLQRPTLSCNKATPFSKYTNLVGPWADVDDSDGVIRAPANMIWPIDG